MSLRGLQLKRLWLLLLLERVKHADINVFVGLILIFVAVVVGSAPDIRLLFATEIDGIINVGGLRVGLQILEEETLLVYAERS